MCHESGRIKDRLLEGGRERAANQPRWSRWLGIFGITLALSSALTVVSVAQERIDPGSPTDPPAGTMDGWQVLGIPGLPAGAVLGDLHVSAEGVVHVWAYIPARVSGGRALEEGGEGERVPAPERAPLVGTSVLYRFDGMQWTEALRTPGQQAVALFGDATGPRFASTVNVRGEAQLYQFDGNAWTQLSMPGPIRGSLHTLAGIPGDMYFRVDGTILRYDGNALTVDFTLPAYETPVRGLVYLGADALFAMGNDGHYLREHGMWSEVTANAPFPMVQDAWGTRDLDGFLHLFAVGSDAARCGLKLWSFREDDLATHAGEWLPVLADPLSGAPGAGDARHLWGFAGNDAYATGVVEGEGHLLRFDGSRWNHLVPPVPVGTVHGVWGTPQGVVWFSTESGNLIRYQRANRAPDLSAVRPSMDRLWPPDLSLVPVHLTGIVDPDGDAVSVEITRVTQSEPLVTDGHVSACPDAAVAGNLIRLRAEHMSNGGGRTYAIEFTATDRLGAMSRGHVYVFAPHYVDTPVAPGATVFDAMGACPGLTPAMNALQAETIAGALRIRYALEEAMPIHLGVYDISGRMRAVMAAGVQGPGAHEARWDLDRLEPGVYFVKLRTTRGPALVQRVILMR